MDATPVLAAIGLRHWKAALYAGIIAAVVSLIVETPIVWFLADLSLWVSARMAAAMVLGREVLPPPATFDLWIVTVALSIHLVLSMLYGLILALILTWFMRRMTLVRAIVIGVVFGLALYLINLHGFAPLLFPWFIALQNGITVFSHIVFGAALGGAYVAITKRAAK